MSQRIYVILGGPLDGKAFRPSSGRIPTLYIDLDPYGDHISSDPHYRYEVVQVHRPREPLMVPRWVLVHASVPRDEILWRTFMATMRAFCLEVLNP
ncbi:hypothetical protein P9A48_gp70 [Xanthomonas phage Mallos]|uniref:Uncharacterized protein n=1 Tax=Xanthomonas phage Mallos TaxID=2939131 RepID=A0A9E7E1T3_9CAUD|nr:hypothetical protein P9A48_gp70 [Xanthomonas phage Mallos]URA07178.1 hypothetical protein Mallos_BL60070 [Xanthomonas phage Mallos]